MWFKNLIPYRLTSPWKLSPGALEERLGERVLHPCSGMTAQSQGWVPPFEGDQLVCAQGRQMLIALGVETKILPSSVIKDETEARADAHEQKMGYRPGRKQMRELREQVAAELLPRAFARRQAIRAWIDPEGGWLYIDSANAKKADELTVYLRDTLGQLAIEPLDTAQSASSCMTQWLAKGTAPGSFDLDQDCEMKSGGEDPAAVRFSRHGLDGDVVRRHLEDGKTVTQLGLTWKDRMRLVLADPGMIKRIRFDMIEEDRAEYDQELSPDERFDADFALMCGELSALVTELVQELGGIASR